MATLIALLALTVFGTVTLAEDAVLTYEGRVLWLSMQSMVVGLGNAPAVTFDLARMPQREIMDLSLNDHVVVTGVIMRPGPRMLATSIQRISPWFPQQAP